MKHWCEVMIKCWYEVMIEVLEKFWYEVMIEVLERKDGQDGCDFE